jgi:hypothetical protein
MAKPPWTHDQTLREALADRGYRVLSLRPDQFTPQITAHPEIFGTP